MTTDVKDDETNVQDEFKGRVFLKRRACRAFAACSLCTKKGKGHWAGTKEGGHRCWGRAKAEGIWGDPNQNVRVLRMIGPLDSTFHSSPVTSNLTNLGMSRSIFLNPVIINSDPLAELCFGHLYGKTHTILSRPHSALRLSHT
jgi:hypothetical protein